MEEPSVVSSVCCDHVFLLAGEDDLRDVRSAVADLAGRWEDLGISLGVRPGDLEAILSASAHSPSSCLKKMLHGTVAEAELQCMYHSLKLTP